MIRKEQLWDQILEKENLIAVQTLQTVLTTVKLFLLLRILQVGCFTCFVYSLEKFIAKHKCSWSLTISKVKNAGLVYDICAVISTSWNMKWRLLVKFSPFIFVVVAFGIFILWNGGIVLGMLIQFTYYSWFCLYLLEMEIGVYSLFTNPWIKIHRCKRGSCRFTAFCADNVF